MGVAGVGFAFLPNCVLALGWVQWSEYRPAKAAEKGFTLGMQGFALGQAAFIF